MRLSLAWECSRTTANCAVAQHKRGKSQQGEDLTLIRNVFCDVCTHQRTYLEIGALDGMKYSNTLVLERDANWGGLLIEGLPANAKNLILNRGKSGRNVIFNEACSLTRIPSQTNPLQLTYLLP